MKKIVNGIEVDCTPEEEAAIYLEWAQNEERDRRVRYRLERAAEYPKLTDQIGAIMKYLAKQSDLPDELSKLVADIDAVKKKYPKPE